MEASEAGLVMLFPTVRGTASKPGFHEGMFGEVGDEMAAGRSARGLPGVDPDRVYLSGRSTGGTLALLVAESTDLFRAASSFGPVGEPDKLRAVNRSERVPPIDLEDADHFEALTPVNRLLAARATGVTGPSRHPRPAPLMLASSTATADLERRYRTGASAKRGTFTDVPRGRQARCRAFPANARCSPNTSIARCVGRPWA